jgi:hypothetical protein
MMKIYLNNRNMEFDSDFSSKEKSHFEDIPKTERCNDINHKPPTHLHIPYGKKYIHVCPSCGKKQTLQPPQITL